MGKTTPYPMEATKRLELQRLIHNGYIPIIQELAKSMSAPFWWHEDFDENGAHRSTVRHSGTICFVDTGARKIGVTACHVYDAFLRDVEVDPTLLCQLGGASFNPVERLIDRDPVLDLATFDVPEIVVNSSRSNLHAPRSWPPTNVKEGDLVVVGGWPASHRREAAGRLETHFASFITKVDQSSADRLGIALNMAGAIPSGRLVLPSSPDLGGASGGPVFLLREEPVVTLSLVGCIYQYHQPFEIILARHASAVNADGTLARESFS